MGIEIEKLKKIYLQTEVPSELEFFGFEDVLTRIQEKKRDAFYIYKFAGIAVLIVVVMSGFVGITFASKPNSTLYPLKVAAQKAIADVAHTTPKNVEDTINNFIEPSQKVTPTNAPLLLQSAPTPTPTSAEKHKSDSKREDNQEQEEQNSNTQTKQEVKGISVTKETEEQQNSQQQSQARSDSESHSSNQENNNSDSHSNNNSSGREKD